MLQLFGERVRQFQSSVKLFRLFDADIHGVKTAIIARFRVYVEKFIRADGEWTDFFQHELGLRLIVASSFALVFNR